MEKRLIDANALRKLIANEIRTAEEIGTHDADVCKASLMMAVAYINIAPTVDAVQVVRCKDCKRCHRFADDSNSNMKSWCLKFSLSKRVNDDDFCAWGERKDDE